MMRQQVDVGLPEAIARAEQRIQRRTREVAEIDEPEAAELQHDAGRARVLVRLLRRPRRAARRVRASRAVERAGERRARRAHDRCHQTSEWKPIARLRLDVARSGADGRISLERVERSARRLLRFSGHRAVIDERADRHERGELGRPAVMVRVEMRDQKKVDPLQRGIANGSRDAVRVARLTRVTGLRLECALVSGKSGIDEQRLTRGRHDERRLPAFDVDEVDVERPRGSRSEAFAEMRRPQCRRREDQCNGESKRHLHLLAGTPARVALRALEDSLPSREPLARACILPDGKTRHILRRCGFSS